MDAEADRGARTAPSAAAGSTTPRRARPIRSFSRASQAAAERAGRAAEAPGGLIEGETLEVAEDHRQAESLGQAVDLAVEGLGLLAVDGGPVGRRGRRLGRGARARAGTSHRVVLLPPLSAGDLLPHAPRRPGGDAIEPVAQQLGVADRASLLGQDQESGLEGVLGVLDVAEELSADAQDHRPMPAHQRREGGLAGRVVPG